MSLNDLSTSANDFVVLRAQVCVVGAGPAGYAVAAKLSALGFTVVVLESGNIDGSDPASSGLNAISNPGDRYSRAETNRSRGLGGTSRHWGGRMIPISRFETRPRPQLGEPGWPIDIGELKSFDHDVEALFSLNSMDYEQEPGAFWRSLKLSGEDAGIRCRWAKTATFGRRNLHRKWLALARHPAVTVITTATANRLELNREAGRIDWVEAASFDGQRARIFATHFVLATGTIEATRLMLWTRECLQQPTFGGPGLGHHFQDHLRIDSGRISSANNQLRDPLLNYVRQGTTLRNIHFELSEKSQQDEVVYGAFAYVQMDLEGHPLLTLKEAGKQLQEGRAGLRQVTSLVRHSIPIAKSLYGIVRRGHLTSPPEVNFRLFVCVEQQPVFDNRIKLTDARDRFGVPLIGIDWKPSEQDGRAFKAIVERLGRFWLRSGIDKVAGLTWDERILGGSPLDVVHHAKDAAHPSGSTRMGTDKDASVVSPMLICHDAPNLSIVSASVFPTAGSANPTLTLMTMGMWHAEHLVRSGKV